MSYILQNRKNHLVVLWRITSVCNLGCHFCGYSKSLQCPRSHVAQEEVHRFIEILGDYRRKFNREVLITRLGGEPFLWPPLTGNEYGIRIGDLTNVSDIEGLPERYHKLRAESRAAPCSDCHSTQVFGKYKQVFVH